MDMPGDLMDMNLLVMAISDEADLTKLLRKEWIFFSQLSASQSSVERFDPGSSSRDITISPV